MYHDWPQSGAHHVRCWLGVWCGQCAFRFRFAKGSHTAWRCFCVSLLGRSMRGLPFKMNGRPSTDDDDADRCQLFTPRCIYLGRKIYFKWCAHTPTPKILHKIPKKTWSWLRLYNSDSGWFTNQMWLTALSLGTSADRLVFLVFKGRRDHKSYGHLQVRARISAWACVSITQIEWTHNVSVRVGWVANIRC